MGLFSHATTADRYESLSVRADRSFEWHEWASAAGFYELMLDMRPDSAEIFARAIVASELAGDSIAPADLMERAMAHGIGLSEVLAHVRNTDYRLGYGDRYGEYLYYLRARFPWMERALDHELLTHFVARADGPMIVKYASIMLAGLPDSVEYLMLLARGYELQADFDQATAIWHKILETHPDCYDALLWLGNYYALTDRPSEAILYLTRAQSLRPTPFVARIIDKDLDMTH